MCDFAPAVHAAPGVPAEPQVHAAAAAPSAAAAAPSAAAIPVETSVLAAAAAAVTADTPQQQNRPTVNYDTQRKKTSMKMFKRTVPETPAGKSTPHSQRQHQG